MNPSSEDIKNILEDSSSGLGLTFATDLFVSEIPTTPDRCVVVIDTGGFDAEVNYTYERPTLMVRVRGDRHRYKNGYTLAKDVKDVLNGLANETWNSTRYVGIWAVGDVNFLGYDKNHRPEFSVNFRIHRTE